MKGLQIGLLTFGALALGSVSAFAEVKSQCILLFDSAIVKHDSRSQTLISKKFKISKNRNNYKYFLSTDLRFEERGSGLDGGSWAIVTLTVLDQLGNEVFSDTEESNTTFLGTDPEEFATRSAIKQMPNCLGGELVD